MEKLFWLLEGGDLDTVWLVECVKVHAVLLRDGFVVFLGACLVVIASTHQSTWSNSGNGPLLYWLSFVSAANLFGLEVRACSECAKISLEL